MQKDKHLKKRRGWGFYVALIILLAVFLFSSYKLIDGLLVSAKEKRDFAELSAIVAANTDIPDSSALPDDEQGPLPQYLPLIEQNPDFFGWLAIEGTAIDYPVMYSPDRPEYYLHCAFDGSYSFSGVPFVDERCPADGNFYLIYGHHMRNGTMFAQLPGYANQSFCREHPLIRFDTCYEQRQYQVVAAFYSRVYAEDETGVFRYYDYVDLTDKEVFDEYMRQVRAAAIYDTGIDVSYGDELLALSTCNYHTEDGRFVVVAKRCFEQKGTYLPSGE